MAISLQIILIIRELLVQPPLVTLVLLEVVVQLIMNTLMVLRQCDSCTAESSNDKECTTHDHAVASRNRYNFPKLVEGYWICGAKNY